jgi:hypothetical protein
MCLELDQETTEEEERFPLPIENAYEPLREALFEDEDSLYLFDEQYDGVDQSWVGQVLHMTSLSFEDWFAPFSSGPRSLAHPFV